MPYIIVDGRNSSHWTVEDWCGFEGGIERLELDIENPQKFETTEMYWGEKYGWIKYNVEVKINKINGSKTEIHVKYLEKNNKYLCDKYPKDAKKITWGKHTLILVRGRSSGQSIWKDDKGNKYEGPGWRKEEIIGPRFEGTATQRQKRRAEFRNILLAKDKLCAISGEKCHVVLEAAHIVPVRCDGQEVLSNGILLRADLHRLFDAKSPKFRISPETGEVSTNGWRYKSCNLHGRRIDQELLNRIREALVWRRNKGW